MKNQHVNALRALFFVSIVLSSAHLSVEGSSTSSGAIRGQCMSSFLFTIYYPCHTPAGGISAVLSNLIANVTFSFWDPLDNPALTVWPLSAQDGDCPRSSSTDIRNLQLTQMRSAVVLAHAPEVVDALVAWMQTYRGVVANYISADGTAKMATLQEQGVAYEQRERELQGQGHAPSAPFREWVGHGIYIISGSSDATAAGSSDGSNAAGRQNMGGAAANAGGTRSKDPEDGMIRWWLAAIITQVVCMVLAFLYWLLVRKLGLVPYLNVGSSDATLHGPGDAYYDRHHLQFDDAAVAQFKKNDTDASSGNPRPRGESMSMRRQRLQSTSNEAMLSQRAEETNDLSDLRASASISGAVPVSGVLVESSTPQTLKESQRSGTAITGGDGGRDRNEGPSSEAPTGASGSGGLDAGLLADECGDPTTSATAAASLKLRRPPKPTADPTLPLDLL